MGNGPLPTLNRVEEGLRNLLARLEQQSLKTDFQIQRQHALSLALQPYLDPLRDPPLLPLAEEEDRSMQRTKYGLLVCDGLLSKQITL